MHPTYSITLDVLQALPYFKKIAQITLQTFATDISLISLRVRSGYLFDAFSLNGQWRSPVYILADTIRHLRKRLNEYQGVVVIHDDTHDQLFFVNTPMLLERCQAEFGIDPSPGPCQIASAVHPRTVFVLLDDRPRLLQDIPLTLRTALTTLISALRTNTLSAHPSELVTIPSSHEATIQDLVPCAAVILEYPVAYVPETHEQSIFLPWEVLDVYECVLRTQDMRDGHVVCKFSCPHSLARNPSLHVTSLQELVRGRFSARLISPKIGGTIDVRHHQETHERVAL